MQPDFETAHYTNGFAWPDRKFRFKPDWPKVPIGRRHDWGIADTVPSLPDFWDINEKADAAHPFRLATSPSRELSQLVLQRDAVEPCAAKAIPASRCIPTTSRR